MDSGRCIEELPDFLVRTGRIGEDGLRRARAIQVEHEHEPLTDILINVGLISAESLADGISAFTGLRRAAPQDFPAQPVDIDSLNLSFLKLYKTVPVEISADNVLSIVLADPTDTYVRDAFAFLHDGEVEILVGTGRDIEAALTALYEQNGDAEEEVPSNIGLDVERLRELASDAPVIKFVDRLIEEAMQKMASDIHMESTDTGLRCRLRIDGVLRDTTPATPDLAAAVISRIKIMSNLDIAERRVPQDGRMRHRMAGREIDFRVATSPTANGEGAVIRLLDKSNVSFDFDSLGFEGITQQRLLNAFIKPDGIVLVTGPTGSGKTTTLYAGLSYLNDSERKILTIEDPIEYVLDGINQTQVETKINRTFATMLRSFLRQDPDIIMVGEIRDKETAEIAIQAALTGHLVLSTLHTNDASSAITRLLDMGVESFLISSTVRLVIAQRLVRMLCGACKELYMPGPELMEDWKRQGIVLEGPVHRPKGCPHCQNTGYSGRLAVAECLVIDDAIKPLIHRHADGGELFSTAVAGGMQTMLEHGLERVRRGQTSVEEVLRVTMRR